MDVVRQLKTVGLKVTEPRVKILALLAEKPQRHWSVESLYKELCAQGDDIGLATVYRVLSSFLQLGIVDRHSFAKGGYAVYELAEVKHHDHIVCTKCGKVDEFVDPIIEKRQVIIARKARYVLTSHALNLYGVCAYCQ
ncbi:MAG: transcriptional repressor [Legionellales bacterium RIFCSPHIGHO2_12_FULL_37_14]|nr:MAG: transcriptional repressor [Legionellales bacterium RIFCSPHIGHO2_12_FULL_37_14]